MDLKMAGESQSLRGFEFDKISVFLSDEEYEKIDALIGEKHQTLIALHAKLFITDFETASRQKEGVLCIVLNLKNESSTFRMYCLSESVLLWNKNTPEKPEDYVTLEDDFHLFRPEDSLFHFKFRNDEEGKAFENAIRNLKPINPQADNISIRNTLQLKEEYQKKSLGQFSKSEPDLTALFEDDVRGSKVRINEENNKKSKLLIKEKKKLKKIKKEDIGRPWDFRHVVHVGWNSNKGLDCRGEEFLDPRLKEFFGQARRSSLSHLQNVETRESSGSDSTEPPNGLEGAKEAINVRSSGDAFPPPLISRMSGDNLTSSQTSPEIIKPSVPQLPKVILSDINNEQKTAPEKPVREAPPRSNKVLVNYLRTKIADGDGLRKSLAAPPPPPKIKPSTETVKDTKDDQVTTSEKTLNIETQRVERVSFSTLPRPKESVATERLSLNTSAEKSRNSFVLRPAPPLPPTAAKVLDGSVQKDLEKNDNAQENTPKQDEAKTEAEAEVELKEAEPPKPVPAPRKKGSN